MADALRLCILHLRTLAKRFSERDDLLDTVEEAQSALLKWESSQ